MADHMAEQQMLYRVEDGAKLLDVSRATLYELLRDGTIESVKIGRSRRIPRAALEKYVAGLRPDLLPSSGAWIAQTPTPAT